MANIKTRFLIAILVLIAFFGPFMAVIAIENAKRESKFIADQAAAIEAKKAAEEARYQYYINVAQQRDVLKKSMTDAKAQYDKLLQDQPKLIQDSQKMVTQTTLQPVVTEKVVEQSTTTTSSAAATKPKTSTKTKTS
jgi:hypothetical protein